MDISESPNFINQNIEEVKASIREFARYTEEKERKSDLEKRLHEEKWIHFERYISEFHRESKAREHELQNLIEKQVLF